MTWKTKTPATKELAIKIAEHIYKKQTAKQIATDLGMSFDVVKRIMRSKEYIEIMGEYARSQAATMTPLAMQNLEVNLGKNNIKALEPWFKLMGVGGKDENTGEKKDSAINIILPGSAPAKEIKDIELEPEDSDAV